MEEKVRGREGKMERGGRGAGLRSGWEGGKVRWATTGRVAAPSIASDGV
jgi:hypothetical protein